MSQGEQVMSVNEREQGERLLRREHDSVDDFEHLEHDPHDAMLQQPSGKYLHQDAGDRQMASALLVEAERGGSAVEVATKPAADSPTGASSATDKDEVEVTTDVQAKHVQDPPMPVPQGTDTLENFLGMQNVQELENFLKDGARGESPGAEFPEIKSSVLPMPEKSPAIDFLDMTTEKMIDDAWDLTDKLEREEAKLSGGVGSRGPKESSEQSELRKEEPKDPPGPEDLPAPKERDAEAAARPKEVGNITSKPAAAKGGFDSHGERFQMSNDFVFAEAAERAQSQVSGSETGESEFESEAEASPAKRTKSALTKIESHAETVEEIEIAPREIFKSIGIDAWFNPERLNPQVAALIYWREPKDSGIVLGAILGVLLSLAYFSLISVLAYLSLTILTATIIFRVYKTIVQALQKTFDGHPYKDLLEMDLTLPAEKVHAVADVAVAHANAAVNELRRLFLVDDLVDSLKFGVLLWCLTYVGAWVNGMTLIILDVVALFTLPKVYETNKVQIDQNLALVQGKINEVTAKVKAAIPLGKKPEPTKEE